MSKKCPKCYTLNENDSRFCASCGEELSYNDIPQNNQSTPHQQNFNQYQHMGSVNQNMGSVNQNMGPANQNSSLEKTAIIIAAVIIIIILISSISAFMLYLV